MRTPSRLPALLLALAAHYARAMPFDMGGKCAALFHSQKWLDEDDLHNWDYKVRVEPWTVFAHVTVKLHGVNMKVENIYGGTGKVGGSTVTVELNAVGGGGCENCFEISGTGQPSANPELSCSGLLTKDELSSCDVCAPPPPPPPPTYRPSLVTLLLTARLVPVCLLHSSASRSTSWL